MSPGHWAPTTFDCAPSVSHFHLTSLTAGHKMSPSQDVLSQITLEGIWKQFFSEHREHLHFKSSSVKLCTHIVLHIEAQTFDCRKQEWQHRFDWRGTLTVVFTLHVNLSFKQKLAEKMHTCPEKISLILSYTEIFTDAVCYQTLRSIHQKIGILLQDM